MPCAYAQVNFMSSFNSASFPDSLALAKEASMAIGSIDEIQKLHIRSVPLGEQPRRLTHQEPSRSFVVLTSPSQGPTGALVPASTDTQSMLPLNLVPSWAEIPFHFRPHLLHGRGPLVQSKLAPDVALNKEALLIVAYIVAEGPVLNPHGRVNDAHEGLSSSGSITWCGVVWYTSEPRSCP